MKTFKVCKISGRIIETQFQNNVEVLKANALSCGYAEKDIVMADMAQAEYDAAILAQKEADITYADKRRKEYPRIEDQLDMIYWDMVNGTQYWVGTITKIKDKYPNKKDKYPNKGG